MSEDWGEAYNKGYEDALAHSKAEIERLRAECRSLRTKLDLLIKLEDLFEQTKYPERMRE